MPQMMPRFSNSEKKTGICKFCGEKATLLCDMPKDVDIVSMKTLYTNTCDNQICKKCAIKFHDCDFCPECIREIRDIWNKKLRQ